MTDLHCTEPGEVGHRAGVTNTDRRNAQVLGCILFSFAAFAVWPEFDLRVSNVFYSPTTGFLIDGSPLAEAIRMAIWNASILLCLVATVGTALGAIGRLIFCLPARGASS